MNGFVHAINMAFLCEVYINCLLICNVDLCARKSPIMCPFFHGCFYFSQKHGDSHKTNDGLMDRAKTGREPVVLLEPLDSKVSVQLPVSESILEG